MNILFLSVTDQRNHPLAKYSDLHCTYDFNNWIDGFNSIGHNFLYYTFYENFVEGGVDLIENDIENIIQENNINLIIIPNMYYEIGVAFLKKLSFFGTKSVVVFFDDSSRFESTSRFYVGLCDYVVTHESKHALKLYEPYDCNVTFFPCFPSTNHYEKILLLANKASHPMVGVSFVGAKIADRADFISKLNLLNITVSVFGSGWPHGRISQDEMLKIFRDSKISLNFTKSGSAASNMQLKARAFEIILAGGFLLTEYDEELCQYFDVGTEIDVFTTAEDCAEKVGFYLGNPDVRLNMQRLASLKCKSSLNFECAWSIFFNNIDNGNWVGLTHKDTGGTPVAAIKGFLNWSIGIIKGRVLIGEFKFAFDQIIFSLRELKYLASVYGVKIYFMLSAFVIKLPFVLFRCILSNIKILRFTQKGLKTLLGKVGLS